MTIQEALQRYRDHLTGPRPQQYVGMVARYLQQGGRNTDADLAAYARRLQGEGKASSTVDLHLRTIRSFYRYLGVRVPTNPWKHRRESEIRPVVAPAWIAQVVAAARGDRLSPWSVQLLVAATVYGLRATELAALQPADVDLARARIFLRTAKGGIQRWQWLPPTVHCWFTEDPLPEAVDAEDVRRQFHAIAATADVATIERLGWHAIRRALVQGLATAGVADGAIGQFVRWASGTSQGVSGLVHRYSHGTEQVGVAGVEPAAALDPGSRAYDATAWDRHPFLPLW